MAPSVNQCHFKGVSWFPGITNIEITINCSIIKLIPHGLLSSPSTGSNLSFTFFLWRIFLSSLNTNVSFYSLKVPEEVYVAEWWRLKLMIWWTQQKRSSLLSSVLLSTNVLLFDAHSNISTPTQSQQEEASWADCIGRVNVQSKNSVRQFVSPLIKINCV